MVTQLADPSIKRLKKLMRHIEEVRNNCEILGTNLIEAGEFECGRLLIVSGLKHDASKFEDLEWEHLWDREDALFMEAYLHHVTNNDHHPEFWQGIHNMPRRALAECVCDWQARATEFGTAIRPWIEERATVNFKFSKDDKVYADIQELLSLILEPAFV